MTFFSSAVKKKKKLRCSVKSNNICPLHLDRPTIKKNNADVQDPVPCVNGL